jgi:catechol 2,3-dioxygenase-like lactoylglutathione lyase family enzyme
MAQHLGALSVIVRDYDEAKAWYSNVLGFDVVCDIDMGGGKRWVMVTPPGARETSLLLAKATTPDQATAIGKQAGGRVFLFLHSDDFWRDYRLYQERGVRFHEKPRVESYGTVAVFEDVFGNLWDLIQRTP